MVSVVIPLYNRENYIEKSIDSVLNQTYKDLEIIVVDDCSTDNSVFVVKKIQERDSRVKLICCEENGGACRARNIGIDHAEGDYIAFQDSDDYWHEDKLEKSIEAILRENVDFVFTALNRVGEQDYNGKNHVVPSYNLNKQENPLQKLLYLNCVSTQTILAKRELFKTVCFDPSLPRFQDWDLAIQVLKGGFEVYFLDEPLVDCNVLEDSITSDAIKAAKATKILEKKYMQDLNADKIAYHGFYERAAYRYEAAGLNGAECFWKAFRTGPTPTLFMQFVLAKFRLYRWFSRLRTSIMK